MKEVLTATAVSNKKRINYKSDFDFLLHLYEPLREGETERMEMPFPDYDFQIVLTSGASAGFSSRKYIASQVDGKLTNCYNDNGVIHVICNNHNLLTGQLYVEFHADVPNAIYPDDKELTVTPSPIGIELVTGAGDTPTEIDVEVIAPYVAIHLSEYVDKESYGKDLEEVKESIADKQPILTSGENIKTFNGVSLLGSGDVEVFQQEEVVTIPYDIGTRIQIAQVAELGSLCICDYYAKPTRAMYVYNVNTREWRRYDDIRIGQGETGRFVYEDEEYLYIRTYNAMYKLNKATGERIIAYNSKLIYSTMYNIGGYLACLDTGFGGEKVFIYDKNLELYKTLTTPANIYLITRVNGEVLLRAKNGSGGDWYLLDLNTIETEEWTVKYTISSSIHNIWQKSGDDFLIGTNGNNTVKLSVLNKEDPTKIYGTSVDQVSGAYSGMAFMNDYFMVRNREGQTQIIARYATSMGYYASGIHLDIVKLLPAYSCTFIVSDKDNLYWVDYRDKKLHIYKHD